MYAHVFVGGTFDGIHKGHEAVLSAAFGVGDRVTVGMTSDAFIQKFKNGGTKRQSFSDRKNQLIAWLESREYENRVTIVPIDNPYEPAASMDDLDALVVTPDNRVRGEEINARRAKKGLRQLILVEVPLVGAQDAQIISSTRIQNGEIDAAGKLVLPDSMRSELQTPLGTVLVGDAIGTSIETHRSDIVVTVGDVTTKMLLTAGVVPSLSVIDGLVERKSYEEAKKRIKSLMIRAISVASGPGYISPQAIEAIESWSKSAGSERLALMVAGEEDLLTLPAVQYAPIGAIVYYGQPGVGMVEVVVTLEKRKQVQKLLEKFIKK